jgi:hypothetical protein
MRKKRTRNKKKGTMARQLVYFCIGALTLTASWAAVVKTIYPNADVSDVLAFVGASFGGELLLLLVKRVFAKPMENE